ncbi:MAG TPA: ATP-binding protein [Jatrophihabitantaceae bacterium]|jgi:signal transduction histidine kinase
MRLTPRLRIVLVFVLAVPVGWVYLIWSLQTGENIFRTYRNGNAICGGSLWRSWGNGCGSSFSTGLAWFELVLVGLIVLAVGWLAARWALRPVQAMTTTVARLGPTSLGLRLRATGPRDETRRLSDAIDQMLDRVAEGYEAQRRFAANASHELRTPLATQRTLIEVSLADALTAEQIELLSRQLLATNERNENLIEGLLVLAETERGLMSTTPQRLDEVVDDALTTMAVIADKRRVRINAQLAPILVPGERPLLERLVTNLVHNAIKYNVDGGEVHVTVAPPGGLRVANTGPQVAPEQVDGLFEPFRRQSGDRLDHGAGVGLGLTIARSIVAAHGGRIGAFANPGGGLTVDVDLNAPTR